MTKSAKRIGRLTRALVRRAAGLPVVGAVVALGVRGADWLVTRRFTRVKPILRGVGLLVDEGTWVEEGRLLGCAYPRREVALAGLAGRGVRVLVNLHERAHDRARLARHGLREVHLPVVDFTPPSPEQIERGLAAIEAALAAGESVAVHCAAGLGRTGTLLACHLVRLGAAPADAIERVRALRPGSVETPEQVAAVDAFAVALRARRA